MIDRIRRYIFWICGGVILFGALGYIFVLTGSGSSFFGDSEGTLKPTDFNSLSFTSSDNGYLLCDQSLCRSAEASAPMANLPANLRSVRLNLADFADDSPTIRFRSFDPVSNQFEFTERSPGRPLPAIISIKLIEGPNQTTNLAIYSYQPIGRSNKDDHKRRIERWLKIIGNRLVHTSN